MEKTLTRLKSNLKSRRKLSLPMLVGQFHQHWNGQNSNSESREQLATNGPKAAESEELLSESADVIGPACGSSPEDVDCSDDESALGDLSARSPMGKAWLSFGRSRRVKSRNKPRRWPSTPAFLPTSSRANGAAIGGSSGDLVESSSGSLPAPQPLSPLPTSLSAAANGHGGSSHNLATKAPAIRPQPYIQGYHLTLPSFLSNRSRHQQQQSGSNSSSNQSQPRNRQLHQVFLLFFFSESVRSLFWRRLAAAAVPCWLESDSGSRWPPYIERRFPFRLLFCCCCSQFPLLSLSLLKEKISKQHEKNVFES